jgi:hypothetical protein
MRNTKSDRSSGVLGAVVCLITATLRGESRRRTVDYPKPARSCVIDSEAIVCNENGLAVFDLIRNHRRLASAVLCAFDLLELDGKDLRMILITAFVATEMRYDTIFRFIPN